MIIENWRDSLKKQCWECMDLAMKIMHYRKKKGGGGSGEN